jgi:hypothetical protein
VRHEIERLQQHVGGAIAPGRLERVAHESLARQRESRARQSRSRDVAAKTLDFVPLIGPGGDARVQGEPGGGGGGGQVSVPVAVNGRQSLERERFAALVGADRNPVRKGVPGQVVER